jgi:PhzF family phenazine biosynthesis protein
VDAFANTPYSGSPTAISIVENFPSDMQCQGMAGELNLPVIAFVKPLLNQHFHIRWFTPIMEIKLCGHATLAAAHILYQEKIADTITFESLSGALRAYKNDLGITLDFPLHPISSALDIEPFQTIFCNSVIAVVQAQEDIIIELAEEETLRQLQVEPNIIRKIDARGVILTTKAHHPYDFISRFFAPREGIDEDPVTGSAHCKLADYWQKKLGKTKFFAYQASKRGAELYLDIQGERVHITGKAITIMRGEWLI